MSETQGQEAMWPNIIQSSPLPPSPQPPPPPHSHQAYLRTCSFVELSFSPLRTNERKCILSKPIRIELYCPLHYKEHRGIKHVFGFFFVLFVRVWWNAKWLVRIIYVSWISGILLQQLKLHLDFANPRWWLSEAQVYSVPYRRVVNLCHM